MRAAAIGLALGVLACNGSAVPEQAPPSTIVLRLPDQLGAPRRAAVPFKHDLHAKALAQQGCTACHLEKGVRLMPKMGRVADGDDRDALMSLYHGRCIRCHTERGKAGQATGPVTCGECHREGARVVPAREPMRFDASLHARHVLAVKPCGVCHHVLDKTTGKLVPAAKGTDDGCVACHGERDEGKRLSLRNAAHGQCLTCHLERARAKGRSGPVLCSGCHDPAQRKGWTRLERPPRLLVRQKARLWIKAPGATAGRVPFNHQDHEATAPFCSTCHHKGMKRCGQCHTLTGAAPRGGGVRLEQAYHAPSSERSCVGCHDRAKAKPDCAGCHEQILGTTSERVCATCHPKEATDFPAPVELAPLPATSPESGQPGRADEAFPSVVTIGALAARYRPSVFPHRKVVARLDGIVRRSKLARTFHGRTEVLCSGCHHRSPLGARPPGCDACHGPTAHPTRDRPDLKAAYHRQCVGCHQKMGLKADCTVCHQASSAGGAR